MSEKPSSLVARDPQRIHACQRKVFLADRRRAAPLCNPDRRVGAVCVLVGGKTSAASALAQLEKQAREQSCAECAKVLADMSSRETAATVEKLKASGAK